jgi:hypothetical protein
LTAWETSGLENFMIFTTFFKKLPPLFEKLMAFSLKNSPKDFKNFITAFLRNPVCWCSSALPSPFHAFPGHLKLYSWSCIPPKRMSWNSSIFLILRDN